TPGCEVFAEHRLPCGDGQGHELLDAAGPGLFRPQTHREGWNQEYRQPRATRDEGGEVRFPQSGPPAETNTDHAREQEEDHDEHESERRREVARELAPKDRADVMHERPPFLVPASRPS